MKMKWFLLFFVPAAVLLSTSILLSNSKCYVARLFSPENLLNLGLLLAGIVGIFVANRTLKAIDRQAELMHQSLVSTFRPKLVVRRVSIHEGTRVPVISVNGSGAPVALPDSNPWKVEFNIMNIGGSTANVIKHSFAMGTFTNGIPLNLPYSTTSADAFSLEPGHGKDFSVEFTTELTNHFRGLSYSQRARNEDIGSVYFFGFCQYKDHFGLPREVAVLRHYQSNTKRFIASDDPDYEYSN